MVGWWTVGETGGIVFSEGVRDLVAGLDQILCGPAAIWGLCRWNTKSGPGA